MRNIPFDNYRGPRLPKAVQLQRLRNVIALELTEKQQQDVMAYYFEGLSIPQIAVRRGVYKSTVSRSLRRARKKIGQCLRY